MYELFLYKLYTCQIEIDRSQSRLNSKAFDEIKDFNNIGQIVVYDRTKIAAPEPNRRSIILVKIDNKIREFTVKLKGSNISFYTCSMISIFFQSILKIFAIFNIDHIPKFGSAVH